MSTSSAALTPCRHSSHVTSKLAKVRRRDEAPKPEASQDVQYSNTPLYSLEFFPPKTTQGLENLYARIARMALPSQSPGFPSPSPANNGEGVARPSWIQVTWGAGGSTDRWSLEMGAKIQSGDLPFQTDPAAKRKLVGNGNGHMNGEGSTRTLDDGSEAGMENTDARGANGVDALLHLTCTNVTLESLRDTLREARKAGVRNILALRGDPPRGQEYWVAADSRFQHAADLVRFIREEHGDFFCVGVAGYPEGHPDDALLASSLGGEEHSEGGPAGGSAIADPVERDIRNLLQKQDAGAEFVVTQLFYNADAFLSWERRAYAAGLKIPIIPGIMPIINYQSFRRMTTLCKVRVPDDIFKDLQQIKGDDAQVRTYGVEVAKGIIRKIWLDKQSRVKGFHLCTLNLEKSVSRIIAELDWWCPGRKGRNVDAEAQAVGEVRAEHGLPTRQHIRNQKIQTDREEAQAESSLSYLSISPKEATQASLSALASSKKAVALVQPDEASSYDLDTPSSGPTGVAGGASSDGFGHATNAPPLIAPSSPSNRQKSLRSETAATWDEFPNGRFGDIRSPAYGEIDGYGASLKIPPIEALRIWGRPVTIDDISTIFVKYLLGGLEVIPWCDVPLMEETDSIRDSLLRLNASPSRTEFTLPEGRSCELQGKAWWTVGSQPAVDGIDSTDPAFGFGPRGGYVYQKAFVEFFVSQEDKEALKAKIQEQASEVGGDGLISYFAGGHGGQFETNVEGGKANAVTWAVFPGQEIVQPTIIEEESFKAWCAEAFAIWTEWESLFAPGYPSQKLLRGIREERWLMTIVHHDFKDQDALWRFLECA